MTQRNADTIFGALFLLLTAAQLAVILFNPFDLSGDEAHYWEWSRRLDIAYYSKGPLVAWLIAASTHFLGATELGVRLPAVICFGLFSLIFYIYLRGRYGADIALISWLAVRSALIFAQTGLLMTTDAPAVLFALLCLISGWHAVERKSVRSWCWFAVFAGLGIWAKYTLIMLVPAFLLFLLCAPVFRREVFALRCASMLCIVSFFLLPLIVWNMQNGWVNVAHNAGHVVHAEAFRFRPRFFFELLAGQAGLVGPLLFAGLCGALWAGYQRRRKSDLFVRYLLFMTLPLVFFVVAVSLTKRVYANWPMPVYVGALLLAAHLSAEDEVFRSRVRGWIAPAILLNLLITLAAHAVLFNINFGLPGNILPTKKLAGWQKLGEAVDRAIYTGRQSSADMFVMTDEYAPASAVSFYSAQHPFVYCTNTGRRRMNQYDVWIKPKDWAALRGKRALVVLKHAQDAEYLRMKFSAFLPAAPQPDLQFVHSGTKIREFFLFWGEDFDGSAPISPQAR